MTGSKKVQNYELYGVAPLSTERPSFGLPIYRSGDGDNYGQIVDELTGRIAKFDLIDLEQTPVIQIKKFSTFRAQDSPAYCIIEQDGRAFGGTLNQIRSQLESILSEPASTPPIRLQIAGLIDRAEELRLRKSLAWNPPHAAIDQIRAYNRSLGRSILWEKLLSASKNTVVAERTLLLRPQIDLDVNDDGSVKLYLSSISESDYPSLQFSNLAASIESELGASLPSNDDGSTERFEEAPFTITPDQLKTFLNREIGSDARIRSYTYTWTTQLLEHLGFRNLEQVRFAIEGYSSRRLSYIASGNLQGQTTKFEFMLLAAMGKLYIERHIWRHRYWFGSRESEILARFINNGIVVKNYDPADDR